VDVEPHERPAYGSLGLGGLFGLVGVRLGAWATTWGVPSGPDEGLAAGLAAAAIVFGFAVAGALLLAGLALAGVGWWSLRTGRTTPPSVALGTGLGFVGSALLTAVSSVSPLLVPALAVLGGVLDHRLAPAPPGAGED
jgi:hypothetical protein